MWNEVLGALTILAMVILCANASRIVEALCDRIRYDVQTPLDDVEENTDDEAAAPAEPSAKKPITAATSKTVPVEKPAAARNAA